MIKAKNDSATHLKSIAPVESSPVPAIDKQAEERLSIETKAWLQKINKNMKRMSEDEEYRLEIARRLS